MGVEDGRARARWFKARSSLPARPPQSLRPRVSPLVSEGLLQGADPSRGTEPAGGQGVRTEEMGAVGSGMEETAPSGGRAPFRTGGLRLAGRLSGPGSAAPPGSSPGGAGAAHTCTPRPCSWSTRARRAPIPLRSASRCSPDEMPKLTRSLRRRTVRPSGLNAALCPPPVPPRARGCPESGQAGPPPRGLLPLTVQSCRPRPPGSRSRPQ